MLNAVRVYKINIRENILRQVVFTNKNLFLGFCALTLFLVWKLGESWGQDLGFSLKIDRQPLLKILSRMLLFYNSNKKFRY